MHICGCKALTICRYGNPGDVPKMTQASQQVLATGEGSPRAMDLKSYHQSTHPGQHNQLICDDVLNVCAREYTLFYSEVKLMISNVIN